MTKSFKGADAKVVVGVTLDEPGRAVLAVAAQLCRRTGMGLRAVHVTEPPPLGAYTYDAYASAMFGTWEQLAREIQSDQERDASAALESMLAPVTGLSSAESRVVPGGGVAEALIAEAEASDAPLLVVGVANTSHRFTPRGWSTALTLMATAPVPVLAVKEGAGLDFRRDAFELLIADDLTGDGLQAVTDGLAFASALGKTEVVHAHAIDARAFELGRRRPAAAAAELQAAAERRVEEELRRRADGLPQFVDAAGGRYETQVLVGRVADEVSSALFRLQPDVAVFGRHRALHHRPFAIGRVPFAAMLAGCRAVLVAPPG